jgi:hypothetical protein
MIVASCAVIASFGWGRPFQCIIKLTNTMENRKHGICRRRWPALVVTLDWARAFSMISLD